MKVAGVVERGSQRGKKDFVPTANFILDEVPAGLEYGIYAVEIHIDDNKYQGVAHFGPRSSVDDLITFEVHIFDFNDNLYGRHLAVEVLVKIRDIVGFESDEALLMAINNDIEKARVFFKGDK